MFFQGLRRGTVEKAEWSDIFVKDSRWYFRIRAEADKSRSDRVVPLHKRSVEALQSLGVKQTGLIFGTHDYRAILAKVLKHLKLRHIRLHDFRHARVDELVQKTTDLSAIQYLAGHRDFEDNATVPTS
jgi:integrase